MTLRIHSGNLEKKLAFNYSFSPEPKHIIAVEKLKYQFVWSSLKSTPMDEISIKNGKLSAAYVPGQKMLTSASWRIRCWRNSPLRTRWQRVNHLPYFQNWQKTTLPNNHWTWCILRCSEPILCFLLPCFSTILAENPISYLSIHISQWLQFCEIFYNNFSLKKIK